MAATFHFTERLRAFVDEQGSQVAAAAALNTSQQSVDRWLEGAVPDPKVRGRVAEVLGLDGEETAAFQALPARARRDPKVVLDPPALPAFVPPSGDETLDDLLREREVLLRIVQELSIIAGVRYRGIPGL